MFITLDEKYPSEEMANPPPPPPPPPDLKVNDKQLQTANQVYIYLMR